MSLSKYIPRSSTREGKNLSVQLNSQIKKRRAGNNRKRTRGRNYLFVNVDNNKTIKIIIND